MYYTVEVVLEHEVFQAEFDRVNDSLGTMICNVVPFIKATVPSIEDLKLYLSTIRPELQPQLFTAKSFDDVQIIIRKGCSITNIVLLESIVKHYSVTEAEVLISNYDSNITEICEKRIYEVEVKKISLLTCDTIKFVVNWEVDSCTLSAIKNLLQRTFKKLEKRVEVVRIGQTNSIAIICYAPYHLMDDLFIEAEENIEDLKRLGLIQLTIGYYTVYSKHEVSV